MTDPKYGVLFKSSDEVEFGKDPYVEKFEKFDIKCEVISVLKFDFINLEELKAKLNKFDHFSGIIFLSPRCVKAVKLAGEDMLKWKKHKIFVVGEKTAKLVEIELGLSSEGSASGNAKALAEYILKQNISKPLLLPTGNLSRDVLWNILTESEVRLDHIVVYKTIPVPNIETNIKEIFEKHSVRYVVYFSPSAVDVTFPVLRKLGIQMNNIKWGAIGPTTEKALINCTVPVSILPESPTPEHFATALERSLIT